MTHSQFKESLKKGDIPLGPIVQGLMSLLPFIGKLISEIEEKLSQRRSMRERIADLEESDLENKKLIKLHQELIEQLLSK